MSRGLGVFQRRVLEVLASAPPREEWLPVPYVRGAPMLTLASLKERLYGRTEPKLVVDRRPTLLTHPLAERDANGRCSRCGGIAPSNEEEEIDAIERGDHCVPQPKSVGTRPGKLAITRPQAMNLNRALTKLEARGRVYLGALEREGGVRVRFVQLVDERSPAPIVPAPRSTTWPIAFVKTHFDDDESDDLELDEAVA